MDLSVIIVSYNTKAITCACLSSLIEHTKEIDFELIVVDNASIDYSVNAIKTAFPEVLIIENHSNIGFGRANNIGASFAKGEFLLFLNSDTILVENSLKQMVDFFRKNETPLQIGSLGCILVSPEMVPIESASEFPTCKKEAGVLFQSFPFIGRFFAVDKGNLVDLRKEYVEVDYVIGADLMMKACVFEKLRGFDPAFFMYFEESDLQKRMLVEFSLKSYIYTNTKIIHLEGASGKSETKRNNKKRIIITQSRNIYLKKHDMANLKFYKRVEKLYYFLNKFNLNYTKAENKAFEAAVKKTNL